MSNPMANIFPAYIIQIPLFIVWLAGIGIAISNYRRYPRPAVLTLVGLVLVAVVAILSVPAATWLPIWIHTRGIGFNNLNLLIMAVRVISILLSALGWLLVILAVFTARPPAEKSEP